MNKIVLTLGLLVAAQSAWAEKTESPIRNAEVVVFDAACNQTSSSEGYLTVNLQMKSGKLFVRGNFVSDRKNLVPLSECQRIQADLTQQAGRKIFLSGYNVEESYEAYEEIWGRCQMHPMEGRGTYPCVTSTRPVTLYYQTIILEVGPFTIVHKNY